MPSVIHYLAGSVDFHPPGQWVWLSCSVDVLCLLSAVGLVHGHELGPVSLNLFMRCSFGQMLLSCLEHHVGMHSITYPCMICSYHMRSHPSKTECML